MTLDNLIALIVKKFMNPMIGLMIFVSVLVFVWGLIEYVNEADNAEKRNTGSKKMLWGIIGFTIMVSAISLLNMVASTVGVNLPG